MDDFGQLEICITIDQLLRNCNANIIIPRNHNMKSKVFFPINNRYRYTEIGYELQIVFFYFILRFRMIIFGTNVP